MASGEDALRGQITELKEKIAAVKKEMAQLQKRRKAYIAKLKLMENHLDGYHSKESIKGSTEHTDSSDESFSTTELLELSLSSISSSVLGSISSYYENDSDKNDSDCKVEGGKNGRFRYKRKQKNDEKVE
ncbi:unnamed protein product [Cercopithifilaria johnstoni]|uniref:Uncharacterized protein n=1 Tax=Cercopithifilaria johnstoni TaxID=2874296 RepID=A0A8J2PRZ4_9BILA|nr:unnamed protein product [Cercopithifilaria johnstoni]